MIAVAGVAGTALAGAVTSQTVRGSDVSSTLALRYVVWEPLSG